MFRLVGVSSKMYTNYSKADWFENQHNKYWFSLMENYETSTDNKECQYIQLEFQLNGNSIARNRCLGGPIEQDQNQI